VSAVISEAGTREPSDQQPNTQHATARGRTRRTSQPSFREPRIRMPLASAEEKEWRRPSFGQIASARRLEMGSEESGLLPTASTRGPKEQGVRLWYSFVLKGLWGVPFSSLRCGISIPSPQGTWGVRGGNTFCCSVFRAFSSPLCFLCCLFIKQTGFPKKGGAWSSHITLHTRWVTFTTLSSWDTNTAPSPDCPRSPVHLPTLLTRQPIP
jgi:hypothetical protein